MAQTCLYLLSMNTVCKDLSKCVCVCVCVLVRALECRQHTGIIITWGRKPLNIIRTTPLLDPPFISCLVLAEDFII